MSAARSHRRRSPLQGTAAAARAAASFRGATAPREGAMNRRRLLHGLAGLALGPALLAGCSPLGSPAPRAWYRLDDLGPAGADAEAGAAAAGAAVPRVLLVEAVTAGALQEASALVYARGPGAFAHYRFASWTEPPAQRIAALIERRLGRRGRFRAVGRSTSGLRADLLLRVAISELFHDAAAEPGAARVALDVELIDWRTRSRIARRIFERSAPMAEVGAQGAAAAMSRALTSALDELGPWVEGAAAEAG